MKIFPVLIALFSMIISGCNGIRPMSSDHKPAASSFTPLVVNPVVKQTEKRQTKHHAKGRITLSWDAVAGASWYNLYYGTKPGVTRSSKKKITKIDTPSHTVTGLSPGTVYFFVVTAANAKTESAESREVSGKAK